MGKQVFVADLKSHFATIERLVENESVVLHHVLASIPQVRRVLIIFY